MSSFKRKTASKQPSLPAGTRTSPSSASTVITSTGIPSFDDILGGGLPLSCSCLVLAPDSHSAYGELVQKYFICQGLATGQRVCIIDDAAEELASECMWTPGAISAPSSSASALVDDDEEEKANDYDNKVKIAWRYEQMKQFQTTVTSSNPTTEEYCRTFDLTCRIPESVIGHASASGQITFLAVSCASAELSTVKVIAKLTQTLMMDKRGSSLSPEPLRICIPALGSPQWGNLRPRDILAFLIALRGLLRRYTHACASLCLAPHLCTDGWGGNGWVQKLGWLSDSCITLSAFTADPSLLALFPSHHGLVQMHTLPAPHVLLPPSDKFSTLRGVSSSASSAGGGGENNLAFKCMRKRLIFETLHLDVEGGVGERRTTPATTAIPFEAGIAHDSFGETASMEAKHRFGADGAAVPVRLEETSTSGTEPDLQVEKHMVEAKPTKANKRVAFRSDAPDLYDF